MSTPNQDMSCKDAAIELAEKLKYEDWFLGTCSATTSDGQEVIYFKYRKRNPEKHRLYQYHGYPVLMREAKTSMAIKLSEACKGK